MVPSKPMLVTPAFSATTAPSAAKRMGAVMRMMENRKSSVRTMLIN